MESRSTNQGSEMNRTLILPILAVVSFVAMPALSETAIAPEVSPPGDIPDNQAFIPFAGPGFKLKVPEGWAQSVAGDATTFADKFNTIRVILLPDPGAKGPDSGKDALIAALSRGRAVAIKEAAMVKTAAGPALHVAFDSNSEPDPVTTKQLREENEAYVWGKGDHMVELILSAPKGADNVDSWRLISSSFRWK